jgi:hypothetical protein
MDIERPLDEWVWTLWREWQRLIEEELRKFAEPVQIIVNNLLSEPLSPDWRKTLHAYLDSWSCDGYRVAPKDRVALFQWIRAWAGARNLLPPGDAPDELELRGGSNLIGPGWRTIGGKGNVEIHWTPRPEDDPEDDPPEQVPTPPALQPDWPRLSRIEREREQNRTGLPSWYPFQPTNRTDPIWEQRFEELGHAGRERLLRLYIAIQELGDAAKRMSREQSGDVDELLHGRDSVQRAFDDYLTVRIDIEREWLRYLNAGYDVLGIFVLALIEKIDRGLPAGIEPLESPLVAELKVARMASFRALEEMRKKVEGTYTALLWTDRVLTAIQWINIGGSILAGARGVFQSALKKGATRTVAARSAATYFATQVTVAVGSAAAARAVIPRVLAAFGLNDAQVQIGLAIYASIGALAALKTGPAVRRRFEGRVRPPRKKHGKSKEKEPSPPPNQPPPMTGRGIWDLQPYDRALAVEAKLGANLHRLFKTIDRWDGEIATSIKSLDLAAPSYANGQKLTSTIRGYIDTVAQFNGGRIKGYVIDGTKIRGRGLRVGIPPGATALQQKVMEEMISYGATQRVSVTYHEVF